MSETENSQERTEEPTEKRKRESKEKGSVVRSKELNSTILLLSGALAIIALGDQFCTNYLFETKKLIEQIPLNLKNDVPLITLFQNWGGKILTLSIFIILIPILIVLFTPFLLGGYIFSPEIFSLKWDRMDPISGLKKIVSIKGAIELVKSIVKLVLIAAATFFIIMQSIPKFYDLSFSPFNKNIFDALNLLKWDFFYISSTLIIVVVMDIPFQSWDHFRQLKMTRQELKDELKDTEGRPEVKSRIHKLRRELAKRRMMQKIPEADVVITNPTHYAVALKYDQAKMSAPKVVAKGVDLVAAKIMEVARAHTVPLVSIPPLARAIYYSTEIEDEIPGPLYHAVAQVLAYVHQLILFRKGKAKRPKEIKSVDIPDDYKR